MKTHLSGWFGGWTLLAVRITAVIGIVAAITAICFRVVPVNGTAAGFAYLAAILFIATKWGLTEALAGSLAAVACFNYFFIPPVCTFSVADPQNWVALLAFLATCVTASHLSMEARKRTQEATDSQREVEKLYTLSRSILLLEPSALVPKKLAMQIARSFDADAMALYDRNTQGFFIPVVDDEPRIRRGEGSIFRFTLPVSTEDRS